MRTLDIVMIYKVYKGYAKCSLCYAGSSLCYAGSSLVGSLPKAAFLISNTYWVLRYLGSASELILQDDDLTHFADAAGDPGVIAGIELVRRKVAAQARPAGLGVALI